MVAYHTASAGRVLQNAGETANVVSADVGGLDDATAAGRILESMSEQVAAQLTRHWLVSTLMRSVKMDMGEIPVKRSVIKTRADGQTTIRTIEVYARNSAGVMAGVKLLLEEDDRRAKLQQTVEHQAQQTGGDPEMSLGARLLIKAYGPIPKRNRDAVELDEDPDELGPDYSDDSSDPEPPEKR